jgi:Ca2+-dependent lipid-binding protein
MPSELKVIIYSAKNLPVMEKSRNTTDAYCEVYFGKKQFTTVTIYDNLEPVWDEPFEFDNIDDEELQENVL